MKQLKHINPMMEYSIRMLRDRRNGRDAWAEYAHGLKAKNQLDAAMDTLQLVISGKGAARLVK